MTEEEKNEWKKACQWIVENGYADLVYKAIDEKLERMGKMEKEN